LVGDSSDEWRFERPRLPAWESPVRTAGGTTPSSPTLDKEGPDALGLMETLHSHDMDGEVIVT
jgi:hypothetical protein